MFRINDAAMGKSHIWQSLVQDTNRQEGWVFVFSTKASCYCSMLQGGQDYFGLKQIGIRGRCKINRVE